MKKLITAGLVIVSVISIISVFHKKDEVVWICPKDEEISFIQTSEKAGKLYVITGKGDTQVVRAVYGPGKADILFTLPGKPHNISKGIIQGHDPNEFILASNSKARIYNIATKKAAEIKTPADSHYDISKQPFSPDGKWLALGNYSRNKEKSRYQIYIVNRQTGDIAKLKGIESDRSCDIVWTKNGLMVFDNERGVLYKGDENGVKPILDVKDYSYNSFISPDGNELINEECLVENEVRLVRYDLKTNKSAEIYKTHVKLLKKELMYLLVNRVISKRFQYSSFSDEMTVSMNWPPIQPIYIGRNRIGREIPIYERDRRVRQMRGIAIWKPGVIAYVKDKRKKLPDVILSHKMN